MSAKLENNALIDKYSDWPHDLIIDEIQLENFHVREPVCALVLTMDIDLEYRSTPAVLHFWYALLPFFACLA